MRDDVKKLINQYGQYIYPKPTEDIHADYFKKNIRLMGDPYGDNRRLWPEGRDIKGLNVLCAGCGSEQAAIYAYMNPSIHVTGVDLSERSIAHENKLINKHKIKNLKLICGDFRDLKESFDLIICTGVIHHLLDPQSALIELSKLMNPNGVLYLAVYPKYPRDNIEPFKQALKTLGLGQNDKSAEFARNIISRLNKYHPVKIYSDLFKDIQDNGELIDLFLHEQECFFNIKEIIELADQANLKIKNFCHPERYSLIYTCPEIYYQEKMELGLKDRWALAEVFENNPNMHHVYLSNKATSVSYAHQEFDLNKVKFSFRPGLKIKESKDSKISMEYMNKFLNFNMPDFKSFTKMQGEVLSNIPYFEDQKFRDIMLDSGLLNLYE